MMTRLHLYTIAALSLCCVSMTVSQSRHTVRSPDRRVEVGIDAGDSLSLSIFRDGKLLTAFSPLSLTIDGHPPLSHTLRSATADSVKAVIHPVVPEKRRTIPDEYHQLTLRFADDWSLVVRVYDDGVAYRYRLLMPGELTVANEQLTVRLADGDSIWFPEETSFLTHSERLYKRLAVHAIADSQKCCLPAVVTTAAGPRLAITESDLLDYPGLSLRGTGRSQLHSVFPHYPAQEELTGDRTVRVTQRAPYLARTRGPRDLPWRVVGIAEKDGDLIENDIVYRLATPTALAKTDWIRPGKVAWDWWNANNVFGVPFRSGVNTDTYRYYIDFASDHGIEYVILDEGWSTPSDLFAINPEMDMEAIFAHARKKHVGIILWVLWNALDARMAEALDRFAAWGAQGIKVDFMQRDDQKMVNFYERVAVEAARRHLLVDFHGAYKPTGLNRTYPNVLTREGVLGLEHSKWSANVSPQHDVTLPFTRMFAGAMDFTPGAMRNASRESFRPVFEQPMSQGTRCHQLAMYVVYESPLQMLSDNPSVYRREPEMMEFLRRVPTTWDDTRVLAGEIGKYVAVARRKGKCWYVGAMTDWTPRELTLDLGFIGNCTIDAYEDGVNAARYASDYVRRTCALKKDQPLRIRLGPGGGWAAVVRPTGR